MMEGCHLAWQENSGIDFSSQDWTLDDLCDQFEKAVQLSNTSSEEDDNDNEENQPGEDKLADEEDDSSKVNSPYKNKYIARIMLIEMKSAVVKCIDKFSDSQSDKVHSHA